MHEIVAVDVVGVDGTEHDVAVAAAVVVARYAILVIESFSTPFLPPQHSYIGLTGKDDGSLCKYNTVAYNHLYIKFRTCKQHHIQ